MYQSIISYIIVLLILLLNSSSAAQFDSDSTDYLGVLEIDGRVISGKVDGTPILIPGARIDHLTIFPDDPLKPLPLEERTENVYYIAEDGEFTLLIYAETENFLQFSFPNHYTKKIWISLKGSSTSEFGGYFTMRSDVILGEVRCRRARRILENEFVGIGWYDPVSESIVWDEEHQKKIMDKISRRHWWWPWKIKES